MTKDLSYTEFLASKQRSAKPVGFDVRKLPDGMFPFQDAITKWALRIGRAALFCDVGLGKTFMQLAWADAVQRKTKQPVLILAPLAVGPQTVREAAKFGVKNVHVVESQSDVKTNGIHVTNYHKLHRINPDAFGGIVLDESSVVKNHSGATTKALIDAFARTPYRLCCTATPAPNDHEELGNHAEFLGVMSRVEMLATWFVHDSSNTADWRLKGHAEKAFWEWVASWAMVVKTPADLGYDSTGYDLPPLDIVEHVLETDAAQPGQLFAIPEGTLDGQRKARRKTLSARVEEATKIANAEDSPCIVWCELNDEADECEKAIAASVQIAGRDDDEDKEERILGFIDGKYRVIVTKGSIVGHGLNWQHCHRMVFVGPSHSFEQFLQCIGRCRRYGQARKVQVHVVTTTLEYAVFENVKRKWLSHDAMFAAMIEHTARVNRAALGETTRMTDEYKTGKVDGDGWTMQFGDNVESLRSMPDNSLHCSIFSPPYLSMYTYSASVRDMGNCPTDELFYQGFEYVIAELLRVMKPGRIVAVDCMNVPAMKERDGYIGLKDFRGELIRRFVAAGFIWHSEHCMWKDPLIEATRTKSLGLMHKQLVKDSSMCRAGIPQYLLAFRKPGENPEPIAHAYGLDTFSGEDPPTDGNLSHERWRRYASPVWMDIDFTNTLNYREAREEEDERHICPLALGIIERAVWLWSNPGDVILDPFAGIGSTGHVAVKEGRRFIGIELKDAYHRVACQNLERAAAEAKRPTLFDTLEPEEAA